MKRDPIRTAITLMRRSQGEVFCVSIKNPAKPAPGNWKDYFFKRSELNRIPAFVKKHRGKDTYMCPQGFVKPRRHKEYAVAPNLFFADLDDCDPDQLPIKPTVLIESSPGRYVGYWYTDEPVPEELNRRLTYFVGADPSGWDWSQVLRMPGTRNHKYPDKPLVRVVWSDGPRYELSRLEKVLPEIQTERGHATGGEAQRIYEQYETSLPRRVRKELINPRVDRGADRSRVLWWLIQELVEAGLTKEEIFTLIWDNDWNKFRDRSRGERMLERQIAKAIGEHVGGSKKLEHKKEGFFNLVPMDQVKEEQHQWLVENMIALGEVTLFEGDPGVGKSYFLMWLAIHFCDGRYVPWEENRPGRPEPLRVVYCDTENSIATVTKSRLIDNGLKNQANYIQLQDYFSLKDEEHLNALEREVILGLGAKVIVIDPVNPYLGDADNYNAKDVQQALQDLKALARLHGVAIILVRHLNKSKATKALYAGGGSIGFAGLARVVATIGWHPEEPNMRVVACTKNNLSMPFGSLGYSIEPLPDTLTRKNRSKLIYEGRVDYVADDIIGTSNIKDDSSIDIAADLIRERMSSDGEEINYHSLLKAADSRSISERSIKKAAAKLGLQRVIRGRGKSRETLLVPARTS